MRKINHVSATIRTAIVFAAAVSAACSTIPFDQPREASYAIDPGSQSTLYREVGEWTRDHDGQSGFYPLFAGTDALGARLRLIASAERSIDAQYFLMKPDIAGNIFAGALLQAADRGVRVRFLLDDVFTTADDASLLALDRHPNIEVRLYNPVSRRGISALNFLGDFRRANRRMHNKSFTVDNQVTIIGGRNIADEYFELNAQGEFLDFDVIGIGPVAAEVSDMFDLFWNHSRSVPLAYAADGIHEDEITAAGRAIADGFATAGESRYEAAVASELVSDLYDNVIAMFPAPVAIVTDHPDKLVNEISDDQRTLVNHLKTLVEEAKSEVIVVTPYFVPLSTGVEYWSRIAGGGVRVVIVTNSLASNNHIAVHSAYGKYRRPIILGGAELYEIRADAVSSDFIDEGAVPESVTLHTKLIIVDRQKVVAGSLNLDPRSIDINAEMGAVIESPAMADALADAVLDRLSAITYRVELDDNQKLRWRAAIDGNEIVETSEPLSSIWRRIKAFVLRVVPDKQL